MAIDVHFGGQWDKLQRGTRVRVAGAWEGVKHLFRAEQYWTEWEDPHNPPPVDWEPELKTRWHHAASFVPPEIAPPTPELFPDREHEGFDSPIHARVMTGSWPEEPDPIRAGWRIEIMVYPDTGSPWSHGVLPIPTTQQGGFITINWSARHPANITVRTRYVNEAGRGDWSAMSNQIFVTPGL